MSEETRDERGESQWFALARARGNVGGLTKLGRAFGALRVHASAWFTPPAPLRGAGIAQASPLRDRAGGAPR